MISRFISPTMKIKSILIFAVLLISSFVANAQIRVGVGFIDRPAKQELETEVALIFPGDFRIGAIHNEEKYFFNPKADENTITYFYLALPLYDGLHLQGAYGIGYRRDIEIKIAYEYKWFYSEVGSSETEPFFIEVGIIF